MIAHLPQQAEPRVPVPSAAWVRLAEDGTTFTEADAHSVIDDGTVCATSIPLVSAYVLVFGAVRFLVPGAPRWVPPASPLIRPGVCISVFRNGRVARSAPPTVLRPLRTSV